jgi:hypothetical protein
MAEVARAEEHLLAAGVLHLLIVALELHLALRRLFAVPRVVPTRHATRTGTAISAFLPARLPLSGPGPVPR